MNKSGLTYSQAVEKFGLDEWGRSKVRKIFEIRIHEKMYPIYSIEDYEHQLGTANGCPANWWLDYSDYEETIDSCGEVSKPHIRGLVPYIDSGVHRICWSVNYEQYNTTKYKWDEWNIRNGGKCTISANGTPVYKFFYRELKGALAHAQTKIDEMIEHPFDFINPQTENGRKIWYYGLPAKVFLGYEVGEIVIEPDYSYISEKKWWDTLHERRSKITPQKVSEEEMGNIQDEDSWFQEYRDYGRINHGSVFYDGMINWFRNE